MYKGIAGSEGIGIGNVVIIEEHEIVIENKKITDTDAEIARLQGAIEKFVNDTNAMADRMEKTVGAKDADILRGHIQMLQDPTIEEQITALIVSEKITAEKALDQVLEQTAEIFAQIPDELLQQRATDFRDIKARILKILLGIEDYDISAAPAGTVLVAHDLTPSMTAGIVAENIAGILTEVGGRTSHSAILARAMEIPAVLSIDGICTAVKNGDRVVLNGTSGEAIVNPDAETEQKFAGLLEEYKKEKELLKKFAGVPTVSADGTKVELVCNIGKPEDAKKAVECDGEGIGLFRTEFLFMDRDTIPTEEEQFEKGYEILKELGIKALVIIGGDDSNTNACVLAEYYAAKNYGVQVIGCPKTIDGDLKNDMIETSFGFDTACKTYSEVIGNIQRDCNSARKYWHFIKLMGRSASHIALECALQVQPNMCIISEEVEAKDMSLDDIVTNIAKVVAERAAQGNNFGTVLIPEGLVEFIPAMKRLIAELNDFLAANAEEFAQIKKSHQRDYIIRKLSPENAAIYASLPEGVARQLSLDRDPHGNVQVSLIETEKLLSEMVGTKLAQWKEEGKFVGKFAAQHHFFGYEGRCAAPSNFDADYCYSLGYAASALIANGKTGYMSSVRNTTAPAEEWIAGGVPITMMMNMERRHGEMKPVIQKALVKLDGAPFKAFAAQRDRWAMETDYVYPGPIQYFGPTEVCDQATKTLQLEQAK